MGIPVSIAKYKDGKIVSSVYMVARSQEQIIENSRKALDFIGGIRVKVKENAFTKVVHGILISMSIWEVAIIMMGQMFGLILMGMEWEIQMKEMMVEGAVMMVGTLLLVVAQM